MADEEKDNAGPSLELPSLGFGRKRRRQNADAPADTSTPEPSPTPPPAPEPATEAAPAAVPEPAQPPVAEPAPLAPELEEQPAAPVAAEPDLPTATLPADEARPAADDDSQVVDAMVPPAPSAPPLFVDEVSPAARTEAAAPTTAPTATTAPVETAPRVDQDEASTTVDEPRRKATRSLPTLGGMPAAVLTGLVVGLATVGLTFASLSLCEAAKGTSSCGGSGFFLLVAILVAMIFLGAAMLRVFRVADPGSTSFLAVGLMAVLVLLFLVDVIFSWWMIIVIPVFAIATFALAHWVTTAFIEPADH